MNPERGQVINARFPALQERRGQNGPRPPFFARSQTMAQITIPAQVVNGRLQHERRLPEFEGRRVIATLTFVAEESKNGAIEKTPPKEPNADFDPEPPPWLEVEQDLYFPMTVPSIAL